MRMINCHLKLRPFIDHNRDDVAFHLIAVTIFDISVSTVGGDGVSWCRGAE